MCIYSEGRKALCKCLQVFMLEHNCSCRARGRAELGSLSCGADHCLQDVIALIWMKRRELINEYREGAKNTIQHFARSLSRNASLKPLKYLEWLKTDLEYNNFSWFYNIWRTNLPVENHKKYVHTVCHTCDNGRKLYIVIGLVAFCRTAGSDTHAWSSLWSPPSFFFFVFLIWQCLPTFSKEIHQIYFSFSRFGLIWFATIQLTRWLPSKQMSCWLDWCGLDPSGGLKVQTPSEPFDLNFIQRLLNFWCVTLRNMHNICLLLPLEFIVCSYKSFLCNNIFLQPYMIWSATAASCFFETTTRQKRTKSFGPKPQQTKKCNKSTNSGKKYFSKFTLSM